MPAPHATAPAPPLPFEVEAAASRIAVPPDAIQRALELIERGDASARAITGELEQAPEVAGRILRVANGGFAQATGSLQQAVVRIGDHSLSSLLLAATLSRRYEAPLGAYRMRRGAFHRHAEAVADLSQRLATRLCPRKEAMARLAGWLHDVGKLVLAELKPLDPDGWEGPPPGDLRAWEKRVFGTTHDVVGGWLCRRFLAPEELWRAVEDHHCDGLPDAPLSRSLWLADLIARADGHPEEAEAARRALSLCGIEAAWLERMAGVDLRPPCPLTTNELQALRLLWELGSGDAVLERMQISSPELEAMMARSCKVLDVPTVTRAIAICRRMGWIPV